jgi:hypothetical protein
VTAAGAVGTLTIDVTGSLQAWHPDPVSNLGWALLPTGTDGVVFHSAEGAVKPILVVEVDTTWNSIRQAGDVNRDRVFYQLDVIQVLQAGDFYLSGRPASWAQGDWNGDGLFDQLDIVAALQTGNYLQGPYAASSS